MSLRRALEVLPDDRASVSAARGMLTFFVAHPNEHCDADRLARATGLPPSRVESVAHVFCETFVLDCGGSEESEYTFVPSPLLMLEIERYLRSSATSDVVLQHGTERFRNRFGTTSR